MADSMLSVCHSAAVLYLLYLFLFVFGFQMLRLFRVLIGSAVHETDRLHEAVLLIL